MRLLSTNFRDLSSVARFDFARLSAVERPTAAYLVFRSLSLARRHSYTDIMDSQRVNTIDIAVLAAVKEAAQPVAGGTQPSHWAR